MSALDAATPHTAIKSPTQSSAMLSKLKSLPNLGSLGGWPGAAQMAAFNPFGAYMQIAEQWQKVWVDAMAFWTKAPSRTAGTLKRDGRDCPPGGAQRTSLLR